MAISYPSGSPGPTATPSPTPTASPTDTPTPPPSEEHFIHVSAINLTTNSRNVTATVRVKDEANSNLSGALMQATWAFPDGKQASVSGQTDSLGRIKFTQKLIRRHGTYTLTVGTVTLNGYQFDAPGSVLSASIYK
jgi:hypothetical protein